MHIIHVATELAEVAKAGGLGDVLYGLSRAQIKKGNTVEIILPKYDCMALGNLTDLQVVKRDLWVSEGGVPVNNTVWRASHEERALLLIEPHHPHDFFNRGVIYGAHDDSDRFTYFSSAVCAYLTQEKIHPDILHIHDWHTSLIAPLYKTLFKKEGMRVGGVVLTIHNLQYQGKCPPLYLSRFGLDPAHFLTFDSMQDPLSPDLINLLKGGIVYSDGITTVSPTFEKEIKTPLGGFGLNGTLSYYEKKLTGILNGIDTTYWNPKTDPLLAYPYPTYPYLKETTFEKMLKGKKENKEALKKRLGLAPGNQPLASSITRLVGQKGPYLILNAIERTLEKGGQYILLGSQPEGEFSHAISTLAHRFPKSQLALSFVHNEELAHLVYAGADMLVVPSIFEPCGLTQMLAMHYGTIPIVRKTGGLSDTVFDLDTSEKPLSERNGFSFDHPDQAGVNWALDRAINCFLKEPKTWQKLIKQAANQDFSWKHAEPEYTKAYKRAIAFAKEPS